jgi:hypothetical protein
LQKKFRGYLKAFLRKKLICAKKVTKLPALTVPSFVAKNAQNLKIFIFEKVKKI